MAMNPVSNLKNQPVMGSAYFSFTKACFFAGLFRRATKKPLSGQ